MPQAETEPSDLDSLEVRPHRRKGELRLQEFANSAILKVTQFVITVALVPAVGWGIGGVLDRLSKIEEAVRIGDKTSATIELRISNLERALNSAETTNRLLTEKVIGHEYQINNLKQLQK